MILPIVAFGSTVLKKKAKDLSNDYPNVKQLIENMWETMYASNGVGLAAPQIGLSLRLFVVDTAPFADDETLDIIDVKILESFIIGKPLQKDGAPSEVETQIILFIEKLQKHFPAQSIERYDERYTSKLAFQAMIDGGLKKKQRSDKGMIDQVSATLILQSYLAYKKQRL